MFLLDTSILLSSPQAIFNFDEHDVAISMDTVNELTNSRKIFGETGANAREALRAIAEYVNAPLPGGGVLRVVNRSEYTASWRDPASIVDVYRYLHDNCGNKRIVIISNNSTTKILAAVHHLPIEPYRTEQVAPPLQQYTGRREIYASTQIVCELLQHKTVEITPQVMRQITHVVESDFIENEFVTIHDASNPVSTVLAMYRNGHLNTLFESPNPYGITPRKAGQRFAIEALTAPADKIPLVILKGPAGTAKTFLSLAAALEQTINQQMYDRILVTRPNIKFDNDIGYLKGTEEEKIGPLIRPVMDNLELLCRTDGAISKGDTTLNNYVQDLFNRGIIAAQAMAYMRGRSIANTFILLDEAQNMNPTQAFGIISRVGAGTKVVLAGDPEQIDNPELDRRNNGLSYASERMRGSALCAQITFEPDECVRSPLALEAIKNMSNKH